MNVKVITTFSKYRLRQLWKGICEDYKVDKAFPNVKAYLLDSPEYKKLFNFVKLKLYRGLRGKRIIEIQTKYEYGKIDKAPSVAAVYKTNRCFNILVNKEGTEYIDGIGNMDTSLRHELEHIYFYPIIKWVIRAKLYRGD